MSTSEPTAPSTSPVPDPDSLDMLRTTARRVFTAPTDLEELGALGLLGLLTPAGGGGAGRRPVEAAVVAEEAGRALARVPWSQNALASSALGQEESCSEPLASLLAGSARGAVARGDHVTMSSDVAAVPTVSGGVTVVGEEPPDHLVILGEDGRVRLVEGRSDRVAAVAAPFDTTRGGWELTLERAPAHLLVTADHGGLVAAGLLLSCSDSVGALSSTAALVRDHLVQRRAFDRPLASFQALQHRLADIEVLETTGTALLGAACRALALGDPGASELVGTAHAYVAEHVARALEDCIQLSGGIGFTWEFPAHHATRRVIVNTSSICSPGRSLDRLPLRTLVRPEDDADPFRAHAREVIARHRPFAAREGHRAPERPEDEAALRTWYRVLYDHGLLGGGWPEEWGGDPGHRPQHDLVVTEELVRARAPRPIDQVALASHVLLRFGTSEQQARYLPRIRSAEHIWCQLFSEPDCGSDLAGITARAERRPGVGWCLSGQKTWTTDAHWAQMGLALLRTARTGRRHEGLTAFVVPMDAAPLEVRPKLTMGGAHEFNDVFLDGVVLPDAQVIGEVGGGWAVAMSGLELERVGVGGNVALLDLLLADLVDVAQAVSIDGAPAIGQGDLRRRLAGLAVRARAARAVVDDHAHRALVGQDRPADASIAKILYSETYCEISRVAVELLAEVGPVPPTAAEPADRLRDAWLWSRALTISGGSSEIMRTVIARRRLDLPPGP